MRDKGSLERQPPARHRITKWEPKRNFIYMTLATVIPWNKYFEKVTSASNHKTNDFKARPEVAEWVDRARKRLQHCLEEQSGLDKSLGVDAACLLQLPASARLGWQECCFPPRHSLTEEFPFSVCWKLYPTEPAHRCSRSGLRVFYLIPHSFALCSVSLLEIYGFFRVDTNTDY